jgi:hypothetical protein
LDAPLDGAVVVFGVGGIEGDMLVRYADLRRHQSHFAQKAWSLHPLFG